jgi:hypothetical protein
VPLHLPLQIFRFKLHYLWQDQFVLHTSAYKLSSVLEQRKLVRPEHRLLDYIGHAGQIVPPSHTIPLFPADRIQSFFHSIQHSTVLQRKYDINELYTCIRTFLCTVHTLEFKVHTYETGRRGRVVNTPASYSEVSVSDLGPQTAYTDWSLRGFPQSRQDNAG